MDHVDALLGLIRLEDRFGLPWREMILQGELEDAPPYRDVVSFAHGDDRWKRHWNFDDRTQATAAAPPPTGIDCVVQGGFWRRMALRVTGRFPRPAKAA